jgi:hypothetical protein
MEKEFVSYEIALQLKELGFDEECIYVYLTKDIAKQNCEIHIIKELLFRGSLNTPSYQQTFRWFREKYGLVGWIEGKLMYKYCIESIIPTDGQLNKFSFKTHEEAELECLKKLIEIAQKQ